MSEGNRVSAFRLVVNVEASSDSYRPAIAKNHFAVMELIFLEALPLESNVIILSEIAFQCFELTIRLV